MPQYPHLSWQRLLAGGFAFQTAHFAGHPLDRERAIEMFYKTKVKNISLNEIKKEAERYLISEGVIQEAIPEMVKDVEDFYKKFNKKIIKKKSKAWLITWESLEKEECLFDKKIISIRDARVSNERIAEFIEQFYIATQYNLSSKFCFSSRFKINPYPVKYSNTEKNGRYIYTGQMTCGDNPYIFARIVENLIIYSNDNGEEEIKWSEKLLNQ